MKKLTRRIKGFCKRCKREEGASSVEYGLLIALIAAVIVGAVTLLGGVLSTPFNNVATTLSTGS